MKYNGRISNPGAPGSEVLEEFSRRGIVKLTGFLDEDLLAPMLDRLYRTLERAELCEGRSWVAERLCDPEAYFAFQSKLQKRLKASIQEIMKTRPLVDLHPLAEVLAQDELQTLVELPQLLFTAPNAHQWSLPTSMWHVDVPRLGGFECPGVQMFTFVDEVMPGAGGTVVIAGSHRYANDAGRLPSRLVKKHLKRAHPKFKALMGGKVVDAGEYMDAPIQDGLNEFQVVELTGQPGDVYFMDIRLLHSLAPNASEVPRFMLTQRYFATRHGDEWYSGS